MPKRPAVDLWHHASPESLQGEVQPLYLAPMPLNVFYGKHTTTFRISPSARWLDLERLRRSLDFVLWSDLDGIGYNPAEIEKVVAHGYDVVWDSGRWCGSWDAQVFVANPAVLVPMTKDEPMVRENPRGEALPVIYDAGWDDYDDMWGIGFGSCAIRRNPVTEATMKAAGRKFSWRAPRDAMRILINYGIWLSLNPKTLLCYNTPNVGRFSTCSPTAWCKEHCYGLSIRCQADAAMEKYVSNAEFFLSQDRVPHSVIQDIAWAIRTITNNFGVDAIRWKGIGDLVPNELPLLDELTADGQFLVYGFTRKGNVLQRLPVRDNLVIHGSVSTKRLDLQLRAIEQHGTSLVFSTAVGLQCGSKPAKPPWQAKPLRKQPTRGIDPRLQELTATGLDFSVVFGYHGKGRTTRALVDERNRPLNGPECPGTDPFGGGHFRGTCLECGWCLQKPAQRQVRTLTENRKKWVNADSFLGRDYGEVWLDNGRRRRK